MAIYEPDGTAIWLSQGKASSPSLNYQAALSAIESLKVDLGARNEATNFFGQEREGGLDSILNNIEQTFGGEQLYKTAEEKAARLLYFVIKDHPFTDGNKRIGSFVFLLYLKSQNMPIKVNENGLVALALLVAGQMGHVDTEMVMKTYGKWIPDTRLKRGYLPINNWGNYIELINPQGTFQLEDDELSSLISNTYRVEAAGILAALRILLRLQAGLLQSVQQAFAGAKRCFAKVPAHPTSACGRGFDPSANHIKKPTSGLFYMVEAAGIEPASADPLPLALHA